MSGTVFKRAYVKITNVCNLNCSFCPKTKREKRFMTVNEFRTAAEKLRPYTEYIYLHVMGEPLLHPDFPLILKTAEELGYRVNVTTNGTLIGKHGNALLSCHAMRKIAFSLHSFEGNGGEDPREYLEKIWDFSIKADFIVALRLWNGGGECDRNSEIFDFLSEKVGCDVLSLPHNANGYRLGDHIYLETEDRFDWPVQSEKERNVSFCRGLSDQIAVLCDGTVVPCCLDSDGGIPLGNIFREDVASVIGSERAKKLIRGFELGKPGEELCRRCGYAERFSRQKT